MASKLVVLITFFLAAALVISLVNARQLPSNSFDASEAGERFNEGAFREADPAMDPPKQLRYGFYQGGLRESFPWINAHQKHGEFPGFEGQWGSKSGQPFDHNVKEHSWIKDQQHRPVGFPEEKPWKFFGSKFDKFSGFNANLGGFPEFPQRGDSKLYFHYAEPQTKPQN